MPLDVDTIYTQATNEFRTGANVTRFASDFVFAFNRVLDDLYIDGDLSSTFTHLATTSGSVVGLNSFHQGMVMAGVGVRLMDAGQQHKDGGDAYTQMVIEWRIQIGKFNAEQSHALQSSTDADGWIESDIIGLGNKTP